MIGLLLLAEKINLKPFSGNEIRFINNIRSAATISVMNSIMYQDISDMKYILEEKVQERTKELKFKNDQMIFELKVAKKVQMSIIPEELPQNDRIRIAAKMIPLMEVSGDFYDVINVNENTIAIAVIDVSGHGIPAALLTSMIKSEIKNQLEKHNKTEDICSGLNIALYPTLVETGFYFTMFICLADLKNMTLEFTNCGHTEPYLLRQGNKFKKLNSEGLFIGMTPDSHYGSSKIQLSSGDRIFLYTDGITEARNIDGEELGEKRFLKAITKTAFLPIKEQVSAIMTTIETYRDNTALTKKDDITLLAFEVGQTVQL
jgi:serine phosphatase RsbU (regulator of sigma subunit)